MEESPTRRLLAAIDALTKFADDRAAPDYILSTDELNELIDREGKGVGLMVAVAGGRFAFNVPPNNPRNSYRQTDATGLKFIRTQFGISLRPGADWRLRLRSLSAAVQAYAESERKQTDTERTSQVVRTPGNLKQLIDLKRAISRGARRGLSKRESAVEFTNGNVRRADSLLRSLRRNRSHPALADNARRADS
jgi:hypothetical protein